MSAPLGLYVEKGDQSSVVRVQERESQGRQDCAWPDAPPDEGETKTKRWVLAQANAPSAWFLTPSKSEPALPLEVQDFDEGGERDFQITGVRGIRLPCSSQKPISSSRYIVVAMARFSRACSVSPIWR